VALHEAGELRPNEDDQLRDAGRRWRFVADRLRELLFAIVFEAAGAEVWEPRPDWPSGPLEWFEVARLGLRETISQA